MRESTYNALEEIDAAVFTGDEFEDFEGNEENIETLREYVGRWDRKINGLTNLASGAEYVFDVERVRRPFEPEIGDILYGNEFICGLWDIKQNSVLPTIFMHNCNPWLTLQKMGVNIEGLMNSLVYKCPYTANSYYWFLPLGILTNDWQKYRKGELTSSVYDYVFDREFMMGRFSYETSGNIELSMLGHGYTQGTLPTDGNGELHTLKVKITGDDFIVGRGWIWYNK